jgi:6-phosphogluconolactonase (cycloisomerase 2 family)
MMVLASIATVAMLLGAVVFAAPAFTLSSIQLPQIFNTAFAAGSHHDISMTAEVLPNGQFAYKMVSDSVDSTPVAGYYLTTATIPGPSLVLTEGDTVTVHLHNNLAMPVGFSIENVAPTATLTAPAATQDYSFSVPTAGTYIYKDDKNALLGLFGAIIVNKADGSVEPYVSGASGQITPAMNSQLSKEIVLFMIGSTFWGQEISSTGQTPLWTNPMIGATQNDLVRFHILSIGMDHTFHLHAHRWVQPGTNAIIDTKEMKAPQDTHDFVIKAGDQVGPGEWQYHCHVFAHMEAGMMGMFHVRAAGASPSEAGASPFGVAVTGSGNGNGVVTFQITDQPGSWFKSTRGSVLFPITQTQSLEVALPGDSVHFIMNDTNTVHTITSLLWPTGAPNMPMDEVDSYHGGGIVKLQEPGLYVFTCKVHPYMFGAVIVDDPATNGLDLANNLHSSYTLDLVNGIKNLPVTSDLATRLLRTFFIATNPANWQDYNPATNPTGNWHISYPNVDVYAGATLNLPSVLNTRYGNDITLPAISHPATAGVGEVWVNTQFEQTAGKSKPGTATAVDATTWNVTKKVALPSINMDNPHNMWTNLDETQVYQTEWFSNKLDTFNRSTGSLVSSMVVGDAPSHVMTRTDTNDIHVALNGGDGVAEIKATATPTTVNRIIPMQGLGQDATHPHAHWMSADGKTMVTPNEFTGDTSIYNFTTGKLQARIQAGDTSIATGMMPDSSKYYVANLLGNTISVIDMKTGTKIKDLNLLEDYNPVTGISPDGNGHLVVGALPIQTPVSPDGHYMVTANTLSATITITDTRNDTVITTLFADPGAHGVQFGAKAGGGYYAYVSNKFSNRVIVVDADPNNDGNLNDSRIAGTFLLTSGPSTTVQDDIVTGNAGDGGQGILPLPLVYNGWVQKIPAQTLSDNGWTLTCNQKHPINPELCH